MQKTRRILPGRMSATLVILALAACFSGCGASSPQSTLDGYASALEDNDAKAAYELLDEEYRERVPFEKFEERFESMRGEGGKTDLTRTLRSAADEPAYVDARLPYTEFDALEMSLTPGGWKIQTGLFNFYGQRTPRETLHSFVKAVERRKYDVLMRFVPKAYADQQTVEDVKRQFEDNPARIDEMVALLRQNKDNIIKRQGSRAWMAYGPYRIDFLLEDGVWKVEDPD